MEMEGSWYKKKIHANNLVILFFTWLLSSLAPEGCLPSAGRADWNQNEVINFILPPAPPPCVADPDPGFGIRDPVPFWPLDPGSRIPNSYFWELSDNFLGKKFYNSLEFGPNFFLQQFKNKIIIHFEKFVATKNVWQQIFSPLSFVAYFGSEIRDPGWVKIRIRINIPDPQHCSL